MTPIRFYYLLRVLFNTNLIIQNPENDPDWTWLIGSGLVQKSGSASYGLTPSGQEFVLAQFTKLLTL